MSDEDTYLFTTSYSVPKLRYRAHAQKSKPLLHCTKSLKHDDIEIFGLHIKVCIVVNGENFSIVSTLVSKYSIVADLL